MTRAEAVEKLKIMRQEYIEVYDDLDDYVKAYNIAIHAWQTLDEIQIVIDGVRAKYADELKHISGKENA